MDADLPADVAAAHEAAIVAGADGYLDPRTGLFVMTAAYLASRGTCCDSDCRHCPYPDTGQQRDGQQRDGQQRDGHQRDGRGAGYQS